MRERRGGEERERDRELGRGGGRGREREGGGVPNEVWTQIVGAIERCRAFIFGEKRALQNSRKEINTYNADRFAHR
jgi:hypothetical protein